METRYFLEMAEDVVKGSVMASRSDWATTTVPETWLQVSADVYQATPQGSVRQPDGTFIPPSPAAPVRRLTKFAFLRLLTPTEYGAMFNQTDPMLAYGVACFEAAPDPFNIDDPLVVQMLDYAVVVGALTQTRRNELWAAMEAVAS